MNKKAFISGFNEDLYNLLIEENYDLSEVWEVNRAQFKELDKSYHQTRTMLNSTRVMLEDKTRLHREVEDLYNELKVLYDAGVRQDLMELRKDILFKDYDEDDKIIHTAIIDARKVQDFLWNEDSLEIENPVNDPIWIEIFQKRVDKVKQIDWTTRNAVVELRKRVLQQAALSIMMLKRLRKERI